MNIPFDAECAKAIEIARKSAEQNENEVIGTEHALFGIMHVPCVTSKLLYERNVVSDDLEALLSAERVSGCGKPEFSSRMKNIMATAYGYAQQSGHAAVSPDDLALAIVNDKSQNYAQEFLKQKGINSNYIAATIMESVQSPQTSFMPPFEGFLKAMMMGNTMPFQPQQQPTSSSNSSLPRELENLGVDVTKRARDHKLDPIIGRADEIQRTIEILCRKTKNNPVLIGEPGVGKSAIVEGLAQAIVEGNVPSELANKTVFSLDIGSLMAGTMYRGALEEKLKNAINAITNNGNIIVFIDELHTLAQSGSKEGEVTPSDILKPYLARGELQTIGATTTDEYRKFIESDKALERRFQPITVEPPTVEQTIQILNGLKEKYESFHKIKISDEAIKAAATLSDRYIQDRFLPDKAIDLIDEAMSRAKVGMSSGSKDEIASLTEQIKQEDALLRKALEQRKTEEASMHSSTRIALSKKLDDLKLKSAAENERASYTITADDVAEIVSRWTKVPVKRLTETESNRLLDLENVLHKRVIGQDRAVTAVSKAIRRARSGLKNNNRPIGSFMFMGSTGVGKTELCKALGEAMFDDENAVIRLDMSEYMEAHSVAKLIGAPPGYVGYDEGGQLTEKVRRHPYSIVLFDEIEKAHPDVYNMLLQILDDGRLTDAQGRVVSFKNTIVIMTSNVGVDALKYQSGTLGFSADSEAQDTASRKSSDDVLMNALKERFKPEFINRIDVVCIFDPLTDADIRKIAVIMLTKVEKSLADKNIKLKVTEKALKHLCEKGYDKQYGARPLRRVIEQEVEDKIAESLLGGTVKEGQTLLIDCKNDVITVNGENA